MSNKGCVVCLLVMLHAAAASAATFDVQVTDALSGFPVEGAVVALDVAPGDGTPELSAASSLFGFARFDAVPAGSYAVTVTHPGYAPATDALEASAAATVGRRFELVPKGGAAGSFTLDLQALCVTSNLPIAKAGFTVERWSTSDTGGAPGVLTATSDADGRAVLRGLAPGWFRVAVTRPGWEPLWHPSKTGTTPYLFRDQAAVAAMKPVPSEVAITVTGYDPAKDATGPLSGVDVEVLAYDALGTRIVVPPRAQRTGDQGTVGWLLPAIAWTVRVKKLGYEASTWSLTPKADGTLPAALATTLKIHAGTSLEVTLDSPYALADVLKGAKVHLDGEAGTTTAGIVRDLTALAKADGTVLAGFTSLLPGRYTVRVAHRTTLPKLEAGASRPMRFEMMPRETTVEIADQEARQLTLDLSPVTSRVRGTLIATDASADPFPVHKPGGGWSSGPDPIYHAEAGATVRFVPDPTAALFTDAESIDATTDATGAFSAELPPGRYTVEVPTLAAYAAGEVTVSTRLAPSVGQFQPGSPCAKLNDCLGGLCVAGPGGLVCTVTCADSSSCPPTWTCTAGKCLPGDDLVSDAWTAPKDGPWPTASKVGTMLDMHSRSETELTLRLLRRSVDVVFEIEDKTPSPFGTNGTTFEPNWIVAAIPQVDANPNDGFTPTPLLLTGEWMDYDLVAGAFMTLTGTTADGAPLVRTSSIRNEKSPFAQYVAGFEKVPPGDYTITGSHPRFGFSSVPLKVGSWPAPGKSGGSPTATAGGLVMYGLDPVVATFQGSHAVTLDPYLYWWTGFDPYEGSYIPYPTLVSLCFVTSELMPGRFFNCAFKDASTFTAPGGKFTVWLGANKIPYNQPLIWPDVGARWIRLEGSDATSKLTFKVAGPESQARFEDDGYAALPKDVPIHVRAVTTGGVEVPGLPVSYTFSTYDPVTKTTTKESKVLGTTGGTFVFGKMPDNGSMYIDKLTSQWKVIRQDILPKVDAAGAVSMEITVYLERQMAVSGTIALADGTPVPQATVTILSNHGNKLESATTDAEGKYEVGAGAFRPIYVEVRHQGYVPARARFEPAPPAGDPDDANPFGPNKDLPDANLVLTPLPAPTVLSIQLDRHGWFLPGAVKSGDPAGFNPDYAKKALTATWQALAKGNTIPWTHPGFEDENGAFDPALVESIDDPVSEVWLVDRRVFSGPGIAADAGAPKDLPPPFGASCEAISPKLADFRALQSKLVTASDGGAPFHVVHGKGEAAQWDPVDKVPWHAGKLRLWELPSGAFDPLVVAVTAHGAVACKDYEVEEGLTPLKGARLPAWALAMANTIGTLANVPLPEPGSIVVGSIAPSGSFSATIVNDGDYLSYSYSLGAAVREGMKNTAGGLFGLGSSMMGVELLGTLKFTFDGKLALPELTATLGATKEFVKQGGQAQPAVLNLGPGVELKSLKVTGNGSLSVGEYLDPSVLPQPTGPWKLVDGTGALESTLTIPAMRVKVKVAGFVSAEAWFNISPYLGGIPYIGQVLLALDKAELFQINFVSRMGFGADVTKSWTTYSPKIPEGSFVSTAHPTDYHLAGGLALQSDPASLAFLWKLGVGLNASTPIGYVGLSGQFGAPAGSALPGVRMVLNQDEGFLSWPPFKEVEGALSAVLDAKLKLGPLSVGKSWQWDLASVHWQLGTEGFFDLVDSQATTVVESPQTAEPAEFVGASGGSIVEGFYDGGAVGLGGGGAVAFSDVTKAKGELVLELTLPLEGGGFSAPIVIAETPGLLSTAVTPLGSGKTLVVWSEVAGADPTDPFAGSVLRYAVGDATAFDAPGTIAAVDGQALDLRAAATGGGAVITWLAATRGPAVSVRTWQTASQVGGAWGEVTTLAPSAPVRSHALAADEGAAMAAMALEDGAVTTRRLASGVWGDPETLALDGDGAVALSVDGAGAPWAVVETAAGTLRLSRGPEWETVGEPIAGVRPSELTLTTVESGAETRHLVAWIEARGDGSAPVSFAYVDPKGGVLQAPSPATPGLPGKHFGLQVVPRDGVPFGARGVVRYTASPTAIREILFAPGGAGWTCEGGACATVCGDGVIAGAEGCDDGNAAGDDGCDADCEVEAGSVCTGAPSACGPCGNGVAEAGEACDDGDVAAGDGCGPTCAVEAGFVCGGNGCLPICGDGLVVAGEACDDQDDDPADGCNGCTVSPGYVCGGQPSTCTACGDGAIEGVEACDDGDADGGDGCSSACQLEPGWTCAGAPSVCQAAADSDQDGLSDAVEAALGTKPLSPDSDGDTIGDFDETDGGQEVDTDGDETIDALDADADDDGVPDADEAGDADLATAPVDTNDDGEADYRDTDSDGDGVPDGVDTCRLVSDPNQEDADDDGLGDACDDEPGTPDEGGATEPGAAEGTVAPEEGPMPVEPVDTPEEPAGTPEEPVAVEPGDDVAAGTGDLGADVPGVAAVPPDAGCDCDVSPGEEPGSGPIVVLLAAVLGMWRARRRAGGNEERTLSSGHN